METAGTDAMIETVAGTDNEINSVTIDAGSVVEVVDNSSLTLVGTITNNGTIALDSTGDPTDLVISGTVSLTGAGTVTLSNNSAISTGGVAILFGLTRGATKSRTRVGTVRT